MNPDDIKAGVILRVPAGADLTRGQTYYCRVDRVEVLGSAGFIHLMVTKMRADGRITRRFSKSDWKYHPVGAYAIVDTEKISVHQPTGEVR